MAENPTVDDNMVINNVSAAQWGSELGLCAH